MLKIKKLFVLLFINFAVIVFIVGIFVSIPIILNETYFLFTKDQNDNRSTLINYKNIKWSKKHFEEVKLIKLPYKDYIVWRGSPFKGETVNINNKGLRLSTQSKIIKNKMTYAFFGGSTMWGTGSNDENTISSIFSHEFFSRTINFAESGYNARQSLSLLINILTLKEINEPKYIIFFDGANDVMHRCRREVKGLSTHKQNQINTFLDEYSDAHTLSYYYVFQPVKTFIKRIKMKFVKKNKIFYDCDDDLTKAKLIARTLVENWYQAQMISEINGDNFLAILQPVVFFGNPNLKHLKLDFDSEFAKQFKIVYPLIKKYAIEKKINFLDLTNSFDGNEYIYIDFAHVSPNGNKIIAKEIGKYLRL